VAIKIFVITFSGALFSVNHVQNLIKAESLRWKNNIKNIKKTRVTTESECYRLHDLCNIASLCVTAS